MDSSLLQQPLTALMQALKLLTPSCGLGKAMVSVSSVSEQLGAIPEFRGLGPLFKSSPEPVALTELETEYVVRCTKHTFVSHMVFQVGGSDVQRCKMLKTELLPG